ncbi:MAG: hypothetical protein E6K54_07135 [Gammaproteobacteria bacterium]|nr:MAG: hypothetical protein E6K54_07135 [Gammaproteobacteria bacterium]
MRIFNINDILTCVIMDNSRPDIGKQASKQAHYALYIYPYCKNDSDPISKALLKKTLKGLDVACLEKSTDQNHFNLVRGIKYKSSGTKANKTLIKMKKLVESSTSYKKRKTKWRSKKTADYLIKYQFNIATPSPISPLFLLYKQKTSGVVTQESLAKIANQSWYEVNNHLDENLALTDENNNKESCSLEVAADILNEVKKQVDICGIFTDPYFINEKDNPEKGNQLIAENVVDQRYSQIAESFDAANNKKNSYSCDKDTELESSRFEVDVQSSSISDQESQSSDDSTILLTDSDSMGNDLDESETLSLVSEIGKENELKLTNKQRNEQGLINHQFASKEENTLNNWNLKTKEKVKNLLLSYQKHLTKTFFFRASNSIMNSKQSIVVDLLVRLDSTYQDFFDHVYGISTTNILNQHRDSAIIQKIGQFFKRHNKTTGTLLLEDILANLNNQNKKIC